MVFLWKCDFEKPALKSFVFKAAQSLKKKKSDNAELLWENIWKSVKHSTEVVEDIKVGKNQKSQNPQMSNFSPLYQLQYLETSMWNLIPVSLEPSTLYNTNSMKKLHVVITIKLYKTVQTDLPSFLIWHT